MSTEPDRLIRIMGFDKVRSVRVLGDEPAALPVEGLEISHDLDGEPQLVVCFCARHETLADWAEPIAECLSGSAAAWIAWPKRASGVATDLSDELVRSRMLETGLVDTKVCSIDATWSALRFVQRRDGGHG